MRRTLATILLLPALLGQSPATKPDQFVKDRRDLLMNLCRDEAASYVSHRDRVRRA
jgi:hypothetical protein